MKANENISISTNSSGDFPLHNTEIHLQQADSLFSLLMMELYLDILLILRYVHSRSICHFDLKAANILMRDLSMFITHTTTPGKHTQMQPPYPDFGIGDAQGKALAPHVLGAHPLGCLRRPDQKSSSAFQLYPWGLEKAHRI